MQTNDELEILIRNTTCLRLQKETQDQLCEEGVQLPWVQHTYQEVAVAAETMNMNDLRSRRAQTNERNK